MVLKCEREQLQKSVLDAVNTHVTDVIISALNSQQQNFKSQVDMGAFAEQTTCRSVFYFIENGYAYSLNVFVADMGTYEVIRSNFVLDNGVAICLNSGKYVTTERFLIIPVKSATVKDKRYCTAYNNHFVIRQSISHLKKDLLDNKYVKYGVVVDEPVSVQPVDESSATR